MDVLALVGKAYEAVEKLVAIRDKIKDAEARNLIGDLSISLADLKMEVARLKDENLDLQTQLKQKKNQEATPQLVVRDGVLWFEVAPPGKPAGPYCPNCNQNGKLVLMQDKRGTPFAGICEFRCESCKTKI